MDFEDLPSLSLLQTSRKRNVSATAGTESPLLQHYTKRAEEQGAEGILKQSCRWLCPSEQGSISEPASNRLNVHLKGKYFEFYFFTLLSSTQLQ